MNPPEPTNPEFVALVHRELAEAYKRAILVAPYIPVTRHHKAGCKGCGGPMDGVTPGCHNCSSRQAMRRTKMRRS